VGTLWGKEGGPGAKLVEEEELSSANATATTTATVTATATDTDTDTDTGMDGHDGHRPSTCVSLEWLCQMTCVYVCVYSGISTCEFGVVVSNDVCVCLCLQWHKYITDACVFVCVCRDICPQRTRTVREGGGIEAGADYVHHVLCRFYDDHVLLPLPEW